MIKRFGIIFAILFVLIISTGFSSAITGAMGNARMVLYPEVNGWTNTIIEKSILVKNVNDEPINITLQVDEETKFIELIDKSFILEPHTEQEAQFIIKVRTEGTYNGKINVFFSSIEGNKAGVALSSEIIVIAKKEQGYEEEEPIEEEPTEEDDTDVDGGVIDEGDKSPFSGVWMLVGTTLILFLVLIGLIILLSKKGEKRRRKVNARKKA